MKLPRILKFQKKKQGFTRKSGTTVEQDWILALNIFFVAALLLAIFSFFVFRGVNKDELFVSGSGEGTTLLNEELLHLGMENLIGQYPS